MPDMAHAPLSEFELIARFFAGRDRGPGPGKPFSARDAGTLAIRRKPV